MCWRKIRMCAILLISLCGICASEFSYEIPMNETEALDGARSVSGPRASAMGNGAFWTAEKHLPSTIGPGPVRIYIRVYPEDHPRRYTVGIGNDSTSIVIDKKQGHTHRHIAEMKLTVTKASDLIKFRSESPNGKDGRSIWYQTFITNDPAWIYYRADAPGKEVRYALHYVSSAGPRPQEESGNLVTNSGFEEGLNFWRQSDYRRGSAVREFQLRRGTAVHGQYSLDIGEKKIQSDWINLRKGETYTLSFYANAPVSGTVECETVDRKAQTLFRLDNPASAGQWERISGSVLFPNTEKYSGRVRILFENSSTRPEVLIDSIQLEAGKEAGPYQPRNGVNAGLVSTAFEHIFYRNEEALVQFNCYAGPDVEIMDCDFTAYDYFDRQVWTKTLAPSEKILLPVDRTGFFRVTGKINYRRNRILQSGTTEFRYHVVYPYTALQGREKSLLGLYLTNAPAEKYGYAETLQKFGFLEMNTLGHTLMRWIHNAAPDATAENPRYAWSAADKEIETFKSANINISCNFHLSGSGYAAPEWALCLPGAPKESYYEIRDRRNPEYKRISKNLWLDYVKKFVERYHGKISKYVIEDEPDYYFRTLEDYVRFYLDTRAVIKNVDRQIPVFFNTFHLNQRFVDVLGSMTGGHPERFLDGIHCYLSSMHSDMESAKAELPFRAFLRKYHVPLVTATCFSGAGRLKSDIALSERHLNKEYKSLQYFYDGMIWGNSRCHYFYYGVMPGQDNHMFAFDSTGSIKPLFHYFSAANKLIGNFKSIQSVDLYPNFRLGIVEREDNSMIAVIYSLDGRLYDSNIPGRYLDGLGNEATHRVIGPYPAFFELSGLPDWNKIMFTEKIKYSTEFTTGKNGVELILSLQCPETPLASTFFLAPDRHTNIIQQAASGAEGYQFRIPLYQNSTLPFERTICIPIATRWGDFYPEFTLKYSGASAEKKP